MGDRKRITEEVVKRAEASAAVAFIRDDQLVGFALRITPAGAKSFIVESRVSGRMRRFTIGSASRYTVNEARAKARTLLAEMHEGKDPQTARRSSRQRSDSLQAMLDAYISAKSVRETTAEKYRAQMRRSLSDWLEKPIGDITPQMVRLRYEQLLKNSISEANGVMRVLRAVSRRAIKVLPDREDGTAMMKVVPTDSLAGNWKLLGRKTTLVEADELPAWWLAVQDVRSDPSRRALQALLVTGLRVNELLRLHWGDIDLVKQRLTIRDSKTTAFTKFVGPELARWLKTWPDGKTPSQGDRVFAVDDLRAPLEQVGMNGGKRITPHDLRRTFLTFGERAGAPIVTLKMLVNHSTRGDVTLGYIRPSDDDLRHWAAVIETAILNAARGGADVVALSERRAS